LLDTGMKQAMAPSKAGVYLYLYKVYMVLWTPVSPSIGNFFFLKFLQFGFVKYSFFSQESGLRGHMGLEFTYFIQSCCGSYPY
jgi:hypothetical protein